MITLAQCRSTALFAGLAWAVTMPALGWGVQGHQVVARVAEASLSPPARAQIDALLQLEPGATLASISTWADEHRNPATARQHYINFPRGVCVYQAARDCPDGQCVVQAIERNAAVLTSNAPPLERLVALKYLVHFVGDIHQPLHAGWRDDKGGNTYQLQAFMQAANLHAVWDTGLLKHLDMNTSELVTNLVGRVQLRRWSPSQAAEESCGIVAASGFYPGRMVDTEYIKRHTPLLLGRLALAGARLADLLNATLR